MYVGGVLASLALACTYTWPQRSSDPRACRDAQRAGDAACLLRLRVLPEACVVRIAAFPRRRTSGRGWISGGPCWTSGGAWGRKASPTRCVDTLCLGPQAPHRNGLEVPTGASYDIPCHRKPALGLLAGPTNLGCGSTDAPCSGHARAGGCAGAHNSGANREGAADAPYFPAPACGSCANRSRGTSRTCGILSLS